MLKMNASPIKDSMPKEHSCSVRFMSGHVETGQQPTVGEPVMDIAASTSSTSPAVNLRLLKAEHLSSTTPPGYMGQVSDKDKSQSIRGCPKGCRTRKAFCASHQPNGNPLKKIGELDDDHADLVNAAFSVHRARELACSGLFWKEMESFFAPVTPNSQLLLKSALQFTEELNQTQYQVVDDDCLALDVPKQDSLSGGAEISSDMQSASSFVGLEVANLSNAVPSLFQRAISALIVEDEGEDFYNPSEGRNVPFHSSSVPFLNANDQNDAGSSQVNIPPLTDFDCQYQIPSEDDRLLQELDNIGLHLDTMHSEEEEWIDRELKNLEEKRCQQGAKVKEYLDKIDKAIQAGQDLEKRKTVELAMDQLVTITYQKTMGGRGRRSKSVRRAFPKLSKMAALALIERTLSRCKEFEDTGRSCFDQPNLQEILFSASPPGKDAEPAHFNGLRIGGSVCRQMHSKVASRGSRQASARSLKGKNVISRRSGHKDEGGTRNRERKRKMVPRDSTAVTSSLLENSLGTENVTETMSKEKFSSAQSTADKPDDRMTNLNNKLRKVEEFASPANVSENVAEASGFIDAAQLDALDPINRYPSSNFGGTVDDLDDLQMFF